MEKFSYEANGYNREEVNQLINEVILNTEGIIKKCKDQQEAIVKLKEELMYYKRIENELKLIVTTSEKLANDIKIMAQNEADDIIRKARDNADKIINDSLLNAQEVKDRRESLIKNMKIFRDRLKELIEQEKTIELDLEELDID